LEPAKKTRLSQPGNAKELQQVLKDTGFEKAEKELVYNIQTKHTARGLQKKVTGENARYRTFIKPVKSPDAVTTIKVLVVKEDNDQVLGWRVYESR
jgi:hypothetical protein